MVVLPVGDARATDVVWRALASGECVWPVAAGWPRPEWRRGGTHERPEPRARAVSPGLRGSRRRRQAPRIRSAETAVGSGATRSREGRPKTPHAGCAFATGRTRCVLLGVVRRCVIVVGGFYGTSNRSPSVLSTQPLAGHGRDLRRNDPFGVRFHTDQLHASRQRSCADRTETTDLADC